MRHNTMVVVEEGQCDGVTSSFDDEGALLASAPS